MTIVFKKLRLLTTFYRSFALITITITIACALTLYKASIFATQPAKLIPVIFWMKVITSGIVIYYINNYQQKQFLYFQNLGLSKLFLWICTLGFDFILFTATLFLILN